MLPGGRHRVVDDEAEELEAALALVGSTRGPARLRALQALEPHLEHGLRGDTNGAAGAALAALASGCGDNNRAVTRYSLELLGAVVAALGREVGPYVTIALDPLVECLGDTDKVSTSLAAAALSHLADGAPSVFDRLLSAGAFGHHNWRVREQLMLALGRHLQVAATSGALGGHGGGLLHGLAAAAAAQLEAKRPAVRAAAMEAACGLYRWAAPLGLLTAGVRDTISAELRARCASVEVVVRPTPPRHWQVPRAKAAAAAARAGVTSAQREQRLRKLAGAASLGPVEVRAAPVRERHLSRPFLALPRAVLPKTNAFACGAAVAVLGAAQHRAAGQPPWAGSRGLGGPFCGTPAVARAGGWPAGLSARCRTVHAANMD